MILPVLRQPVLRVGRPSRGADTYPATAQMSRLVRFTFSFDADRGSSCRPRNPAIYAGLIALLHSAPRPDLPGVCVMTASDLPATGGISAGQALEIRRAIYSHD